MKEIHQNLHKPRHVVRLQMGQGLKDNKRDVE
jgi:hypothetical protein